MLPPPRSAASTSPTRKAHYFGVGKIDRDQVEDYARRKGMTFEEASAGSRRTSTMSRTWMRRTRPEGR